MTIEVARLAAAETRLRDGPTRFWANVEKTETCWVWRARRNGNADGRVGYGATWFAGRQRLAHHVSHELLVGPIPAGKELRQTCGNTLCVRPDHLEAGTKKENARKSARHPAARTHCPQGHPYDAENTLFSITSAGGPRRSCLTCIRERREQKRAADPIGFSKATCAATRRWRERNPDKVRRHAEDRRIFLLNAESDGPIDRQAIIDRDDSTCQLYCGRRLEPSEITLDHIVPLSKGGPHTEANLQVACLSCNCRKGNRVEAVAV